MTSRRLARRDAIAPVVAVAVDPKRIVQQTLPTPRGEVRGWFRGGECYRARIAGRVYGWGEGPDIWAALLDGSFRPADFGKHNS